ncbi:MAG: class I SAM-dependent methyltransferase [Chloroflexi bacterium]|nr:class I SAM-dependent methyltransferase [Chloroflexota bacterium]
MLPLSRQNEYRRRYAALTPGWQPSGEVYERLVRESLWPGARWLDLGGGRGGLVELLHGNAALTVALDPDWPSLREHRVPALPRTCGLADALPFPADCFDVVTASWLLEHLTAPEIVFAEVNRVLRSPDPRAGKPGGRFMLLTPNAGHPLIVANRVSQLAPRLQRRLVPRLYARSEADTFPVQYKANTPHQLLTLGRRAGFTVALRCIGDPTYTAFNDALFRVSALLERAIPAQRKIHIVGLAIKQ